ncbi:MAG: hypothetical protein K9N47_11800 [Prosthecobacter sp.]|uniref:hypothetical protein n=1 Tax=Prosthecobacter sp. TaxID=1965333 RepID=UPI0025EF4082|nr:hypothetical protein [Prosthecobacter sp.]MCF7786799.1 hypothetical protein [Prosthecobacter sp.]
MSGPLDIEQFLARIAEEDKLRTPHWLHLISKFDGFSPPAKANKQRLLDSLAEVQESLSELGLSIKMPTQELAARWYDSPSEVFSWWCRTADILCRGKAFPAQPFFDLLIRLIERHAELKGNGHPKKLFWRNAELQKIIRTIKPAKTRRWELQCSFEQFKEHITILSTPPTKKLTPLGLKVLTLTDSKEDMELMRLLSAFIHEGNDGWGDDYTFPLSLASRLDASVLDVLTRAGDAQKKIALFALRHDLLAQWVHDMPLLKTANNNKTILFTFVLMLGGIEFAKKADELIHPHDPNHQLFYGAIKLLNTARKNQKARPTGNRRGKIFIKPAQFMTCLRCLHDVDTVSTLKEADSNTRQSDLVRGV